MRRLSIDEVKQQKNFYRNNFHRVVNSLFWVMGFMLVLLLGVIFKVLVVPETSFYATNSVGFITPLNPLDAPNMSSEALLAPDPPSANAQTSKTVDL